MHVIIAVEGIPERHETFLEWIRSRRYKIREGEQRPFVREIRFYDINIKEPNVKDLISDIKTFEYHPGFQVADKINKLSKILVPSLSSRMVKIDIGKIEPASFPDWKPFGWMYTKVLAVLEDPKDFKGQEII